MQPARSQPDTDAVVHEDLDAVSSPVGKQVGVVGMSCTEDGDHPGQSGVGARSHVERLHGHPGRINADHRSTWLSQLALA